MKASTHPLEHHEVSYRAETMRRRLASRCKGLLEAPSVEDEGGGAEVQYLHRTVKDFLHRDDIWEYIVSGYDSFDPNLALCGALLGQMKAKNIIRYGWEGFETDVVSCFHYAKEIEDDLMQDSFLDEVDRAGRQVVTFSQTKIQPAPPTSRDLSIILTV